jgi:hypothetical protein
MPDAFLLLLRAMVGAMVMFVGYLLNRHRRGKLFH